MKAIRWLALCVLAAGCATMALAATLTATWGNPNNEPWDRVRVYRTDGTSYWLVADVAGTETQAVFTVTAGEWTFVARSLVGAEESTNSNAVVVRVKPNPPGSLKVK